ncbi:MAG: outer membrane protein assembly factor BamA [Xanthomonadaceae bacterium]|nr:outer membrane protein assembly factor BamA [Xanthomonadaceae bacterium]MDE2054792.1 outer membrane protein assembly factor BamA [Xanthomonadaceae bacterium]MDE2497217.1 outer membrane protein assembly factor BamA [Xanthomonadaceae bacterium]
MKRVAALILFAALSAPMAAYAFQPFTVSDIRIEGLQRIAAGTVLSYLPIEPGQTMTDATAQKAIKALFKTGFFNDVELEQQGSILIVKVQERPSIASLTVHGNKDIKSDQLLKGLKSAGLAEGQTFDRLTLDQVQQQLVSQYNDRGKYNVEIEPHVTNLDRNRVAIDIEIHEGKAAKIQEINIVGNHTFTDNEIRNDWESGTPNWTSWYSNNDQYSREKLSGDLTKLSSYYLDRGYADFNINSAQVTISPDKRNIYIAAGIHEGDIFKISDIHLLGTLVLPEAALRKVLRIKPGEVFDRHSIELSSDAITDVLSNIGYAFAKVSPVPKVDEQNHTVDLTFYVEPGPRVYVRRINFKGNTNTQDQVLRREMRQYEGAWYSQAAIDRSKVRLQRLGFFKDVNIDTVKVPGTTDEVDLNVKVAEESSGQFQFGVGYSQVSGIILSTSISNNNFLGSGNTVSATFSKSLFLKQYQVSFFDPYLTDSGIGIGYNASVLKLNQGEQNIASYLSDTDSFSTYLSFPISETDSVNVGIGLNKTKLDLIPGYTPQMFFNQIYKIGHYTIHNTPLTLSYAHDTLNSFFKPTRGGLQQISAEIGLPGGTVPYYKLTLTSSDYFPLPFGFVGHLSGTLGYGKAYGSKDISVQYADADGNIRTMAYPFFQNFYAGGVRDVRGFQDNTLGPRICSGLIDANGKPDPTAIAVNGTCSGGAYYRPQPVGGAFKVLGSAELVLPFFKDNNKARISLFTDVGNVYASYGDFNAADLRASAGISLQWIAPVGPIVINLARPIRDQPGDKPFEETLQFYFGRTF